jgi:hypothetical protein
VFGEDKGKGAQCGGQGRIGSRGRVRGGEQVLLSQRGTYMLILATFN